MTVLLYLGLAASRVLLRVLHTELGKMTYIPPVRPHPCQNGRYEMEEHKDYQFSWTVGLQTILSVSLFFGGAVTALAGGLACQRHGAAPVMGGGLAISSVLALFTPLILNSLDWPGMLFIRIAIGHCLSLKLKMTSKRRNMFYENKKQETTSPTHVSVLVLIAQWVPQRERSWRGAAILSAAQTGKLITVLVSSRMVSDWMVAYYVAGTVGFVSSVAFGLMASSNPDRHPYLPRSERRLMKKYRAQITQAQSTPWKKILKTKAVWAYFLSLFCYTWLTFIESSIIYTFIGKIMGISMRDRWYWMVLGQTLDGATGVFSGWVAETLVENMIVSRSLVKKIFAVLSGVVPVCCLLGVTYCGCDPTSAIVLILVEMSFIGFSYPSILLNSVELTPNYSGSVDGIAYSLISFGGMAVPFVIQAVIRQSLKLKMASKHRNMFYENKKQETTEIEKTATTSMHSKIDHIFPCCKGTLQAWRTLMWVTFILQMTSSVIYIVCGSSIRQDWDTEEFSRRSVSTELKPI